MRQMFSIGTNRQVVVGTVSIALLILGFVVHPVLAALVPLMQGACILRERRREGILLIAFGLAFVQASLGYEIGKQLAFADRDQVALSIGQSQR